MTPQSPETIPIPPGTFLMGTPPEELAREGIPWQYRSQEPPPRLVTIEHPFHLGRFPITRGEFSRFVAATGYTVRKGVSVRGTSKRWTVSETHDWRDPGFSQDDTHPVVCVDFQAADAYAAWLSDCTGFLFRLPTEAEWEYACRAGTVSPRFWGEDPLSARFYANVADANLARVLDVSDDGFFAFDDGFAFTSPVGSFRPNPWGLFDMLGNVWEFTAGAWNGDESARALRGGSWDDGPRSVRAAMRYRFDGRGSGTGFRLVRSESPFHLQDK